ncbi:MAG: thioredoxin family protein [Deltaproteobacteria bacterium]|nr:thioredoxin family protein [Deltaproteobacteria bacterium]MCB9785298.1 thioredoxin family protein [Deltaproteobacteria bacterium]
MNALVRIGIAGCVALSAVGCAPRHEAGAGTEAVAVAESGTVAGAVAVAESVAGTGTGTGTESGTVAGTGAVAVAVAVAESGTESGTVAVAGAGTVAVAESGTVPAPAPKTPNPPAIDGEAPHEASEAAVAKERAKDSLRRAPGPPQGSSEQATPATVAAAASGGGSANGVSWDGAIRWRTYDEGLAEAKTSGKPVLFMVYADWCPKCRAWGAHFSDPALVERASRFVMIHQNQDSAGPWSAQFERFGAYVPRIFFLTPEGELREELTSGHPRYPYFYAAQQVDALVAVMDRAAPK